MYSRGFAGLANCFLHNGHVGASPLRFAHLRRQSAQKVCLHSESCHALVFLVNVHTGHK
jgi:hypothetical protein